MAQNAVNIVCPGCGSPVDTNTSECPYCHRPVIITTFNSLNSISLPEIQKYIGEYKKALVQNPNNNNLTASIAKCFLKLKMYDDAVHAFGQSLGDNLESSENFFYASISLLKGKKAFNTPKVCIDQALEYLNAANMIEPKGIYYYFMSYIKYDFFERKFLTINPNYKNDLENAKAIGISEYDVNTLFDLLGKEIPSFIKIY